MGEKFRLWEGWIPTWGREIPTRGNGSRLIRTFEIFANVPPTLGRLFGRSPTRERGYLMSGRLAHLIPRGARRGCEAPLFPQSIHGDFSQPPSGTGARRMAVRLEYVRVSWIGITDVRIGPRGSLTPTPLGYLSFRPARLGIRGVFVDFRCRVLGPDWVEDHRDVRSRTVKKSRVDCARAYLFLLSDEPLGLTK